MSRFNMYGVGGIGVVLAEVAEANGLKLNRAFDDSAVGTDFHGVAVEAGLSEVEADFPNLVDPTFICIGNNSLRQELSVRLDAPAMSSAHPTAHISPTAKLGDGTMVFHGSIVQAGSLVGRHVIVNTAASIDHDCRIGDFVHVAPQVALCGLVHVGEGSEIGAGAVVLPSVKIGRWATVGAGSIVLRDVPDHATVVGNPARIIKLEGRPIHD